MLLKSVKYSSVEVSVLTDKELRRLKRSELLEILLFQQKELERLSGENEKLRQQILNSSADNCISDAVIEKIAEAVKKKIETADDKAGA